jgi:galactose-1-phosphate uridylyltransferase
MTDQEYYELRNSIKDLSNRDLSNHFNEWKDVLIETREALKNSKVSTHLILKKGRVCARLHCYASVISERNAIAGKRAFKLIEDLK